MGLASYVPFKVQSVAQTFVLHHTLLGKHATATLFFFTTVFNKELKTESYNIHLVHKHTDVLSGLTLAWVSRVNGIGLFIVIPLFLY